MVIHRPDFIVVGAMKSATTTLHEQLARQRGVFMSRPKEPNFFSLARTQKAGNNQYLSLDEPVTVKLEGKVYRIEPPKKDAAR